MRPTYSRRATILSAAAAIAILTACSSAQSKTVPKPKAEPLAAAKAAPAAKLGDPATARWTATTHEAAASEANKKVLAEGKQATVTGEVVDVSCYLQLGKRGEAHIACGSKCIANGEPIGIVDADDRLYILFAEEHHPRRDGQVGLEKTIGTLLAKTVTITGMMTDMKGVRGLFVQAAEIDSVMGRAGSGGN
jgi:uncharacterized Zn-binding protein involved in type VI secretion